MKIVYKSPFSEQVFHCTASKNSLAFVYRDNSMISLVISTYCVEVQTDWNMLPVILSIF